MRTLLGSALSIALVLPLAACVGSDAGDSGDPGEVLVEPPLGPPALTPDEIAGQRVQEWIDCMRFQDFVEVGMAPAWAGMPTASGGTCSTCHDNGVAGFVATHDAARFFDLLATNRFVFLEYFAVDVSDGLEQARVVVNESDLDAVAIGVQPFQQHPRYGLAGSAALAALVEFHARTDARFLADACDP
jgi:hypothetical protein